jgi:hypothetical protein
MYNLLVTYTEGAWEKGACEYSSSRAIGGYGEMSKEPGSDGSPVLS